MESGSFNSGTTSKGARVLLFRPSNSLFEKGTRSSLEIGWNHGALDTSSPLWKVRLGKASVEALSRLVDPRDKDDVDSGATMFDSRQRDKVVTRAKEIEDSTSESDDGHGCIEGVVRCFAVYIGDAGNSFGLSRLAQ
jgi:hypothetical protein